MDEEQKTVVETLRNEGIAVLRGVLTDDEIDEVRKEFDQAHLDLVGPGIAGVRDRLTGEGLLPYPALSALYSHPRILEVVSTMLKEPEPFVWKVITNRYNPEHEGVRKHSDAIQGELSVPYSRQAMAVFLDDVDPESGSLTYVPGTHCLHFIDPEDPDRLPPSQEEIDEGEYVPTTVNAGDVVFRVPEVWHAVIPIHRLRRYVTTTYATRRPVSPGLAKRIEEELEERELPIGDVPERLRPLLAVALDRPE